MISNMNPEGIRSIIELIALLIIYRNRREERKIYYGMV